MNKAIIIGFIIAIPSTIYSVLALTKEPTVSSSIEALSTQVSLPIGIILLIIGASFVAGIGLFKLKNRSELSEEWQPPDVTEILVNLRLKYGEGFDDDDALVVEAFQKGREDVDDIALFTNMKQSKVQKIVNKLADRGIPDFEYL
ncbi:MAG: hypothetical protein COA77_02170 [Thaumarchaeota archaeon]|nr:MAG: hypothetical protein COA77_02170 [Nitrososphaerota archaeon]